MKFKKYHCYFKQININFKYDKIFDLVIDQNTKLCYKISIIKFLNSK